MLLDPFVWRGLSIRDYSSWAHQIWHILALRATRRFVEHYCTSVLMKKTFAEVNFECTANFSSLKDQPVHLTRKTIFSTLDGAVHRLSGSHCTRYCIWGWVRFESFLRIFIITQKFTATWQSCIGGWASSKSPVAFGIPLSIQFLQDRHNSSGGRWPRVWNVKKIQTAVRGNYASSTM